MPAEVLPRAPAGALRGMHDPRIGHLADAPARQLQAQAQLGLELPTVEPMLPLRYEYLAVEAFERGELSEGQLARFLRADRLEARRLASELARPAVLSDEGTAEALMLDLGGTVTGRGAD